MRRPRQRAIAMLESFCSVHRYAAYKQAADAGPGEHRLHHHGNACQRRPLKYCPFAGPISGGVLRGLRKRQCADRDGSARTIGKPYEIGVVAGWGLPPTKKPRLHAAH